MNQPTVLVIDNNPLTRKVVRISLQLEGYRVLEAETGRASLELLSHETIDLILQDLVLPDTDGRRLVGELRAHSGGKDIPIIAFSGFPSRMSEARTLDLGFTDYILKPVEPSRLVAIIRSYLAPNASLPKPGRGKRVLVVEDDPAQRELLGLHLGRSGFVVEAASDGLDGLDKARRSPPDAIVSDILMPKLDGFKFCLEVRQDPRLASIPVILSTAAFIEEADRSLAQRVGASAFVVRTPDVEEIVEALVAQLGPATPAAEAEAPELLKEEYTDRVISLVQRQAEKGTETAQRLSWMEGSLLILRGISETLNRDTHPDLLVDDILYQGLEATGAGKGAAYLRGADGKLSLRVSIGFGDPAPECLPGLSGHLHLVEEVIANGNPLELPSAETHGEAAEALLGELGAKSILITPLVSGGNCFGALLAGFNEPAAAGDNQLFASVVSAQVGQAIELVLDISARKQAEEARDRLLEEVELRARQAEAASDELEAFSFSVSHELRAPLRHIDGFSQALLEDHAEGLDSEGREYLQIIMRATKSMGRLIDDLLKLARLSRWDVQKEEIDLSRMAEVTVAQLRNGSPGRSVEVRIEAGVSARGDRRLLGVVLLNLLENAWKFTGRRDQGRIEFGVTGQGDGPAYFVRDNGDGFDMAYGDKLFLPFQRLHSTQEFPGNGIGLAMVKRIIGLHGGRIWADGERGRGATFYFTISPPPADYDDENRMKSS